ncbi:hypothetical protein Syun_011712 [Stephania yunnanensis]|uniref:Uncharacterized protein n=1 Tax=Stephania yunnanensis TaxID=152371 RepID=A0AAP0PFQ3_9MAGN
MRAARFSRTYLIYNIKKRKRDRIRNERHEEKEKEEREVKGRKIRRGVGAPELTGGELAEAVGGRRDSSVGDDAAGGDDQLQTCGGRGMMQWRTSCAVAARLRPRTTFPATLQSTAARSAAWQ